MLRSLVLFGVLLPSVCFAAAPTATAPVDPELQQFEEKRTEAYARDLEAALQKWLVEGYAARSAKAWHRDYSSIEAFVDSVRPNRERWRRILNPPDFRATGPLQRRPHKFMDNLSGEWLSLPLGPFKAEGLLVVPENADGPVPLVIAQHGLASYPERVFGLLDPGDYYHGYGQELLKAGYAVFAPMNLRGVPNRNRIERLCRLADTTLPGIELVRMQRLLDEVLADPRIDPDRVGMWGISLGGLATMFWMPLEPRIQVGVVSAWFNHRVTKMAVHDEKYVSFMDVDEEHAFVRGWLTEFADHDTVSLICPRPLFIQHGRQDRIGWWPDIVKEFEKAREHYQKLGIAERIELDLFDGRHETNVEPAMAFLKRFLQRR